ncbi:MAG: hypothetical protein ACOCUL_03455, partial [Bacteroidota bacterium]
MKSRKIKPDLQEILAANIGKPGISLIALKHRLSRTFKISKALSWPVGSRLFQAFKTHRLFIQ